MKTNLNLNNMAWFGPLTEDDAVSVTDRMMENPKLVDTLQKFLAGDIPPSDLLSQVQTIAENTFYELYPTDPHERSLAHAD